jgi:hypothetical protein
MTTFFGHPRDLPASAFAKAESPFRDRGTDGSNPSPSRRESDANLTPADAERPGRSFCREGRGWGASYAREPARSPDPPGSDPQKGTVPIFAGLRLDQLRGGSDAITRPAYTAFEHIAHAQLSMETGLSWLIVKLIRRDPTPLR